MFSRDRSRFRAQKMHGSEAYPTGAVMRVMEETINQGSLTGEEIAEILDEEELPVEYETSWSVGSE